MKSFIILCLYISACAYGEPIRSSIKVSNEHYDLETQTNHLGVTNGNDSTINKHPYLAAMIVDKGIYCAGAILGKRWIVTNAFCFRGLNYTDVTFRVGSTWWMFGGQELNLSAVYYLKQYKNSYDYNAALVKTTEAINFNEFTKPIKMVTEEPPPGGDVVISGWGTTEQGTKGKLHDATLEVIDRVSCAIMYGYVYPVLTDRMMCAYKWRTAPCEGDGGAPLVYKNKLAGYYLGENACASARAPQVFSSLANMQKMIKQIMKKHK